MMEIAFKYLNYVDENDKFYKMLPSKEKRYFSLDLPKNWEVNKSDDFWTMYHIPNQKMIVQGFKIHISTVFEKVEETLHIVSDILFDKKVAFKHINTFENLFNMYSKHGNRISAGKFITIYPNEEEFIPLLKILEKALKDLPLGPYILTDRRYKKSNVFYRYGAFQKIENENGISCIFDTKGNLIPDLREPRFSLPDFITIPEDILKEEEILFKKFIPEPSKLKLYNIEKVIRFSNAGGIYIASRKEDGKKVVIKEARKEIGLDGQNRNAEYRLNVEYEALKNLQGVDGVVQLIDHFKVWENTFMVIEFVEGINIYSWLAKNYPFSEKIDTQKYFEDVTKIINDMKKIIERMHSKDVAMCDIQTQNIIVDDQLNLKIIDFETAEPSKNESQPALATRGFSNKLNTIAKDRDWYSLNRLFQFLLIPIGAVSDINMTINTNHLIWIYNNFGKEAFDYFYNFQMEISRNITNFEKIFGNTYKNAIKLIESNKIEESIDSKDMNRKLLNSLLSNLDENRESFINGDIRQFEMDGGLYNLQNGGFGAVLTLLRTNNMNNVAKTWIENQLTSVLNNNYNNGYLTGKSGIACTLLEVGYRKEAEILISSVFESIDINSEDFSFRSGLSGIGIALLSFYKDSGNYKYLLKSKELATILYDKAISLEKLKTGEDWQSINLGFFDGYSGIGLFLSLLYHITEEKTYLDSAIKIIQRELDNCKISEKDDSLQILDENQRLLPYFSNGSIGIGFVISILNNISNSNYFEKELQHLSKVKESRLSIEPGFFEGITGLMLTSSFSKDKEIINKTLSKLNLFLIEEDDKLLLPGRMFYKYSSDLHTGVAGILLALKISEENNPLLFLPMYENLIKKPQVGHSQRLDVL